MQHLYTYPLVELDEFKRPVGHASGCIVRFRGQLFLLTVSHATGNMANWAVEVAYVKGSGTQLFQLGQMCFLAKIRLKTRKIKIEDVDFSYKHLPYPIPARNQELTISGEATVDEPKRVLESDLNVHPTATEEYAFWGLTRQCYDGLYLQAVPKREEKMKFVKEKGDLLFFRTQAPYKSYKEYQGCSGAPILNSKGDLVSLVVEGDKKKTGIYGINLSRFRTAFEVEILKTTEHGHPGDAAGPRA